MPAESSPPLPPFPLPLGDQIAAWVNVAPDAFAMALINEYAPGAPIGWHRDAPHYGIVAGVSLLSSGTMKLRPYVPHSLKQTVYETTKSTGSIVPSVVRRVRLCWGFQ